MDCIVEIKPSRSWASTWQLCGHGSVGFTAGKALHQATYISYIKIIIIVIIIIIIYIMKQWGCGQLWLNDAYCIAPLLRIVPPLTKTWEKPKNICILYFVTWMHRCRWMMMKVLLPRPQLGRVEPPSLALAAAAEWNTTFHCFPHLAPPHPPHPHQLFAKSPVRLKPTFGILKVEQTQTIKVMVE